MPTIIVDRSFEKALRKFKKQIANSGILIEVKTRQYFEKPSTKRNRAKMAARRRWLKLVRNQELPQSKF